MKKITLLILLLFSCFTASSQWLIGGGLSGRGVSYEPQIKNQSLKTGRLVMKVCVNLEGDVISAEYTQRGSTTTNLDLRRIAQKTVYQFKFSKGELDKQCGTITLDLRADESIDEFESDLVESYQIIRDSQDSIEISARERLDFGTVLIRGGDYKGALFNLNKAQEIASVDSIKAKVLQAKGEAKYQLGDYRGAIRDFDEALKFGRLQFQSYTFRGISKVELGRFDEGIADLDNAIEIKPDHAKSYAARGLAKILKYQTEREVLILKDGLDISQKRLKGILEDACLDLSTAGDFGYYEAYDLITYYCN